MNSEVKYPFGLKILLFLSCTSIALTPLSENIRYTKYLLILPALIFLIFSNKRDKNNYLNTALNKYLIAYVLLYTLMVFFSFIVLTFNYDYYFRFFAESLFLLNPILLVYLFFKLNYFSKLDIILKYYFWAFITSYVIAFGPEIIDILIHPTILIQAIISSTIATESILAFIFGLFTLYFILRKDKFYSIISLVFTIISFKRIALLALLFSLLINFILNRSKNIKKKIKYLKYTGIASNFLLVLFIYLFSTGFFDLIISKWIGESANQFSLGRKLVYESVISNLKPNLFFGAGLAKTSLFLENSITTKINLLHSDLLKIFLEFGWVVFTIWIIVQFNLNTKYKDLLILFIYLNIVFLTDNVLIYFNVAFIFYLMQCSTIINENYNRKMKYYPR